jgi:hypothetical protein
MKTWIVALVLVLALGASFAIGRTTAPDTQQSSDQGTDDLVIRLGDQLRFPAIALFCAADFEIDRAKLLCNRTGNRARYQVVFERDRTKVGQLGYPGRQRVFPEQP